VSNAFSGSARFRAAVWRALPALAEHTLPLPIANRACFAGQPDLN